MNNLHRRPHPGATTSYLRDGDNLPSFLRSGNNLAGPAADALRRRVQLELLRQAGAPRSGEMSVCAGQFPGGLRPIRLTSDCRLAQLSPLAGVGVEGDIMITGRAVPYGVVSRDLGGHQVKFQPGCFAASLATDNPAVLFNHGQGLVLGRKSAGTALFYEQQDGLYIEANPPDTTFANDLLVSMDRGDINSLAANFLVIEDRWDRGQVRVITKAQLLECSVVSWSDIFDSQASVKRSSR